jgi:hypothetical protein
MNSSIERRTLELEIISGGQTGVDRAALDVAMFLGWAHGGWCPKYRLAEDGPISKKYCLRETESTDYAIRTERNVDQADGTLILHSGHISGGTRLTVALARKKCKPLLVVDLTSPPTPQFVCDWIYAEQIRCLNVAGPRESSAPGISAASHHFLHEVFRDWENRSSATATDDVTDEDPS